MYERATHEDMAGMGFSLKPPAWLRNVVGAVVKGTTATVPTPAGPVTVDLGNPASVNAAKNALTGTKFSTTVGQRGTTALDQANAVVTENVPGGWLTVAGLAALAIFVLPRMLGGRR
ncbi:MAG TPA: hypothetical protein VEW68_10700 [Patescibacteria group bacterium]|nr:hypothetical protein [Patescibacteria group bacterium]